MMYQEKEEMDKDKIIEKVKALAKGFPNELAIDIYLKTGEYLTTYFPQTDRTDTCKEINGIKVEFIGVDDFGNGTYKDMENDCLYKADSQFNGKPLLYSCGNSLEGEMGFPVPEGLNIHFEKLPEINENRFEYMLLSRLQSDCEYYLGYGNRCSTALWAGNEKEQIAKMKELYNGFSDEQKPQWLTFEQILDYEKAMVL